jgi:hypothetical protein
MDSYKEDPFYNFRQDQVKPVDPITDYALYDYDSRSASGIGSSSSSGVGAGGGPIGFTEETLDVVLEGNIAGQRIFLTKEVTEDE